MGAAEAGSPWTGVSDVWGCAGRVPAPDQAGAAAPTRRSALLGRGGLGCVDSGVGHGIEVGRRMLMHLHKAAHERGIRFFECEYLGDNEAVAHLIHGAHPDAKITAVGSGQMLATFPVVAC